MTTTNSFLNGRLKRTIVLKFTRELIKHSGEDLFKLDVKNKSSPKKIIGLGERINPLKKIAEEELAHEKKIEKGKLEEAVKEFPKPTAKLPPPMNQESPTKRVNYPKFNIPVLRVPQPRLPSQFNYLRPTSSNRQISLGNLDKFINDMNVFEIEIPGPNQYIFTRGPMGRQQANLFLTKEEIEVILNNFSQISKIPVLEGNYRVVIGNLILNAIVSFELGSKLLIKKITPR